jgi:choline kinase
MRAVLLAAGDDPRLRPHNARAPKALVPVDGVPILRRGLTTLAQAGVDHVTLVVGHLGDQIRTAVGRWFPGLAVEFVANPAFAATGTAASLALARPVVDGEAFVLCDGDVVFAPAAIDRLFAAGLDAVAVRSVGALDGEAVKVMVDDGDRVVAIGRDLPARGALGEAVGLASFTAATSRALFAALAPRRPRLRGGDPAGHRRRRQLGRGRPGLGLRDRDRHRGRSAGGRGRGPRRAGLRAPRAAAGGLTGRARDRPTRPLPRRPRPGQDRGHAPALVRPRPRRLRLRDRLGLG